MAIVFNNQNNSIGLGSTNSSGFTTSISINSTGVGIGTTNPTDRLDVNGNIRVRSGLKDYYGNVGAGGSILVSTGAGVSWTAPYAAGLQGLQGTQGVQGLQGLQGTQGVQGLQGTQGVQGLQGLQGTQGVQGLQGTQGVQGLQGTQGVQGLQGLQGTQGVQGLQGTQGVQGLQGTQGVQGLQGTQGTQGVQGLQGTQGVQGLQGTQGVQGLQGTQGVQGVQGLQGTQGVQGLQGTQGTQGVQGVQGTQGIQGVQGNFTVYNQETPPVSAAIGDYWVDKGNGITYFYYNDGFNSQWVEFGPNPQQIDLGYISNLLVTGISTFSNGPVLIGSGTSTETTSQPLQVTGGAYVSGSVGIGTTNPTAILHISGASSSANGAALKINSGTVLTTPEVGAIEYDGSFLYHTPNSTSGRAYVPPVYTFRKTTAGVNIGAAITDFFTTPSSLSLEAASVYKLSCFAYFTKNTAGNATWTQLFSSAPIIVEGYHWATPVTGITAATSASYTQLEQHFYEQSSATFAWQPSATNLTTAVNHFYRLDMTVLTNAATNWRLRLTQSAGTATPLAGSHYTIEKVSTSTGTFVA